MPKLLRNNGTAAGVHIFIRIFPGRVAGEKNLVTRGMPSVLMVQAADNGELVGHRRALGQ